MIGYSTQQNSHSLWCTCLKVFVFQISWRKSQSFLLTFRDSHQRTPCSLFGRKLFSTRERFGVCVLHKYVGRSLANLDNPISLGWLVLEPRLGCLHGTIRMWVFSIIFSNFIQSKFQLKDLRIHDENKIYTRRHKILIQF